MERENNVSSCRPDAKITAPFAKTEKHNNDTIHYSDTNRINFFKRFLFLFCFSREGRGWVCLMNLVHDGLDKSEHRKKLSSVLIHFSLTGNPWRSRTSGSSRPSNFAAYMSILSIWSGMYPSAPAKIRNLRRVARWNTVAQSIWTSARSKSSHSSYA